MENNTHFISEKKNRRFEILGWILMFPLLLLPFSFYDYFFIHHYWVNRRILYRALLGGRVKIIGYHKSKICETYDILIDDTKYHLGIWDDDKISLGIDIVGLFIGSKHSQKVTSKIILEIKELLNSDQHEIN